jgi:DNA-binding CsgD family transcriptional regulator
MTPAVDAIWAIGYGPRVGRARSSPSARPALPLQWPLVGRHDEVELFESTLADPRAHGFVVHGPPGVGKTRLGDECLSVAHRGGRTVARATAAPGIEAAPLGALAHLLPPAIGDARCDLVTLFDAVAPELRRQGANGALVLLVDDLQWLDTTSATLLAQLVDADLVFLVATVRSGEGLPPGLAGLWHRARVRRVDLGELDRPGVDTLLHLVLRGPVAHGTIEAIWSASRGNVLFMREFVIGALESDRLVEQHGVWQLTGPMVTTPRLLELLEARVGELDAGARNALEVLAVWGTTSIQMLESIVDVATLEALDRAGLLETRADGRREHVALAHPLYGESLRAHAPALTRRRLLLDLAERIEHFGARRREDPIRIATARIDATASADPRLLVEAARLARWAHDFPRVERLARAAVVSEMSAEAGLMLGEALHELGSFDEAEAVLADAQTIVAEEHPLFVLIVEMRALNLMWGLHRHADALQVNRAAQAGAIDPSGAEELALWEATLLAYSGQPLGALAILASSGEVQRPRARALHAVAEVPALIATGKPVTAAALARSAYAEHVQLREPMAIADAGLQIIHQIYALTECGELREAFALASAAYDAMPENAPPAGVMWITHQLGRVSLQLGHAATARRWLGEAVARCEANGLAGPSRLPLSLLATAHAWLGDVDAATAAADDLDGLPELGYARAEHEFGRAWALVASGDVPGGRRVLRAAADLAATTGWSTTEAWLLHDIVRLGDAASVVDRLETLATECEGVLIASYAAHARAAVGTRPEPSIDAADRFEAIGAALLAAEAATEAAQAYQRGGDSRQAGALAARAARLARECEGARTPALAVTASVVPLSARERDIATLAAQGETSKDIAARLYLSLRTVNNHLQNVYTKLGISGRRELAAALDDTGPLSAPPPPHPPSSSRP